jgi:hypothetical protein
MVFRPPARTLLLCLPLSLIVLPCLAQAPVGDVYSADATVKGAVALSVSGTRLMSGSSVKAGQSNASVRLIRGGELRVCQGSSVSLTTSANGSQMMVGMSTGTIEAHFPLANSRDSVMTPDFEIRLNGPAVFHLAVSTDETGNTCVQSLHGNTGSVTISELMGDGSYTLMPADQLIFRAGHASNPGPVVASCGCPPDIAVERATAEPPKPSLAPAPAPAPTPLPPVAALIESSPRSASVTAPPPAEPPGSVHVQVEAPFVFRASEPLPPRNAPVDLAEIRLSTLPVLDSTYVQPAPQEVAQDAASQGVPKAPKKKRHGLWGFFASIFKG